MNSAALSISTSVPKAALQGDIGALIDLLPDLEPALPPSRMSTEQLVTLAGETEDVAEAARRELRERARRDPSLLATLVEDRRLSVSFREELLLDRDVDAPVDLLLSFACAHAGTIVRDERIVFRLMTRWQLAGPDVRELCEHARKCFGHRVAKLSRHEALGQRRRVGFTGTRH